jgi:hypothetical protein
VTYNVSLGRFNLGNFNVAGTVQNGQYSLRGNGVFSVLKGWVFNWQGSINGFGEATTDGANPRSYSFSQSNGKYRERLRIRLTLVVIKALYREGIAFIENRAARAEIRIGVRHLILGACFCVGNADARSGR